MNTKDLLNLAYSFAAKNQFSLALSICDQAVKQDSRNDEPYFVRGYIKYLSKHEFSALSDLTTSINIHPHEDTYRVRGICKENLGLTKWAIDDYDKGLQLYPNNIELLRCKASTYEREGEWEKALESFLKIVKVKKDSSEIYFSISQLYLRLSKYELAISAIKEAYELEPLEHYKNFISEIINKAGHHPIHVFRNFFDGEIVEDIQTHF